MHNRAWYESLASLRTWQERIIWGTFAYLGVPRSYLDIGCGDGWKVRAARRASCSPAIGVEASVEARRYARKWACILVRDFDVSFDLGKRFDLVTSIDASSEVDDVEKYASNIVGHSAGKIVFVPGTTHRYLDWDNIFGSLGAVYEETISEQLARCWQFNAGPLSQFAYYLRVYSVKL